VELGCRNKEKIKDQEVCLMHLRLKAVFFHVLWLLPLALLLSFSQGVPGAWAQYDTYSGRFKFQGTETGVNAQGKFVTSSSIATGTVELYVDDSGPVQNNEGYFLKFSDDQGGKMGITGLALMKTNVPNSKTDSLKGVGIGEFIFFDNGQTGPMYADITGSKVKDKYGQIKITLTIKISGGITNPSPGPNFVFKGSPKVTLTLAPVPGN
jgi:hypothetical protein